MFDGVCSQDRVTINNAGAFNNESPNLTVEPQTEYIQVVCDGVVLVWTGKADTLSAEKQAKAFAVNAGTYAFEATSGDVVHVWNA